MQVPAGFRPRRMELTAESEEAYARLAAQHDADPERNLGPIQHGEGDYYTLGYFSYSVGGCDVSVYSPERPLKVLPGA